MEKLQIRPIDNACETFVMDIKYCKVQMISNSINVASCLNKEEDIAGTLADIVHQVSFYKSEQ